VNFCSQCDAPTHSGGKYCVNCGAIISVRRTSSIGTIVAGNVIFWLLIILGLLLFGGRHRIVDENPSPAPPIMLN